MNMFRWSSFQLARSYKYLTKSLKNWGKQPQRLCITKRGHPTLPSSTRLARPPARPHNPCNPWICSWRRGRRRGWLRGCRFWKSKYIETSRAIRNYPDLVLGTSERFRTVQRHLRTVPNGSEAPPNGSERFRGPLCRFTSGLRVVCVPVPVCSVPWEFSVEGRGFAVQSSDGESRIDATRSQLPTFWLTHLTQKFVWICKKWCHCAETLCNSPFAFLNFRCVTFGLLYFLFSFTTLNFYYLIAKQTILNVHITWVILHAWRIQRSLDKPQKQPCLNQSSLNLSQPSRGVSIT